MPLMDDDNIDLHGLGKKVDKLDGKVSELCDGQRETTNAMNSLSDLIRGTDERPGMLQEQRDQNHWIKDHDQKHKESRDWINAFLLKVATPLIVATMLAMGGLMAWAIQHGWSP